jgi:hypothetical protein
MRRATNVVSHFVITPISSAELTPVLRAVGKMSEVGVHEMELKPEAEMARELSADWMLPNILPTLRPHYWAQHDHCFSV